MQFHFGGMGAEEIRSAFGGFAPQGNHSGTCHNCRYLARQQEQFEDNSMKSWMVCEHPFRKNKGSDRVLNSSKNLSSPEWCPKINKPA